MSNRSQLPPPRPLKNSKLPLYFKVLLQPHWVVHNHPSGDPTPSQADIDITRQVVEAARVLGVSVHDHLVVGRDGVVSFKSKGLM